MHHLHDCTYTSERFWEKFEPARSFDDIIVYDCGRILTLLHTPKANHMNEPFSV